MLFSASTEPLKYIVLTSFTCIYLSDLDLKYGVQCTSDDQNWSFKAIAFKKRLRFPSENDDVSLKGNGIQQMSKTYISTSCHVIVTATSFDNIFNK